MLCNSLLGEIYDCKAQIVESESKVYCYIILISRSNIIRLYNVYYIVNPYVQDEKVKVYGMRFYSDR